MDAEPLAVPPHRARPGAAVPRRCGGRHAGDRRGLRRRCGPHLRAAGPHRGVDSARGAVQPEGASRLALRRGLRPLGARDQPAVRPRAEDDRLRPDLDARRGCVPLGQGRQPLPRHARRLRHGQRRPQQPARPGSDRRVPGAGDAGLGAAGRDAAAGAARGGAARARAAAARALPVHEHRDRGGGGGVEARPRRDEAQPRHLRRPRISRADARLALGERQPGVHGPVRPAAARLRARSVRRPRRARGAAAPRGRRGLPRRAGAGQGCQPAAGRVPRRRAGDLPPLRHAVLRRRGADRLRANGEDVRVRALGARAGSRSRRQVALRRLRAGRRAAHVTRGARGRVRLDGARGQPRLDVRAERAGDGGRPGDAARARRAGARGQLGTARREAARADRAARRRVRHGSRGARARICCGRSSSPSRRAEAGRGECSSGCSPDCSRSW